MGGHQRARRRRQGGTGGGKSPLEGEDRRQFLLRYGALVQSLKGGFRTGEDLGTTSSDMQIIAEKCQFVHGFHPVDGSKVDPSPFTARAVFEGIKSAAGRRASAPQISPAARFSFREWVASVQAWAEFLNACRRPYLQVSDIDSDSHRSRRPSTLGAKVVGEVEAVYQLGLRHLRTLCRSVPHSTRRPFPELRCRIVAGSANNQLAEPADAQRLLERDDRLCSGLHHQRWRSTVVRADGPWLRRRELPFSTRWPVSVRPCVEVLRESAERGDSPVAAAERRVQETLAQAPDSPELASPIRESTISAARR